MTAVQYQLCPWLSQMEYASLAAPHLSAFGPYNATGSPFSVAAGRMSYTYGLKGANSCGHSRFGLGNEFYFLNSTASVNTPVKHEHLIAALAIEMG